MGQAAGGHHSRMAQVHVGCSGWSYTSWRGPVYGGAPAGAWLGLYARLFRTVELNATFYRLPDRRSVEAWVASTPPGFLFAVKASRYLTHVERLRDDGRGTALLFDRLEPLARAGKLGPVLWQLPESFQRDDARLSAFLHRLPLPPARHCIEFRHPSWFHRDVMARLREHGVALVIGDTPVRPFQTVELTAPWTYVRFHWGARGRDGDYAESELQAWAARLRELDVEAWAFFNNDWQAFAPRNALRLRELLEGPGAGAALPVQPVQERLPGTVR